MLLRLPKNLEEKRTDTKKGVSEKTSQKDFTPKKEGIKRTKKSGITDQELSLKIFTLFSQYKTCLITTEEELVQFLSLSNCFGIDTETSGLDFYKDIIAGFSIGTEFESAYIPINHEIGENYAGNRERLFTLLSQKSLYGFNWKFDKHFLKQIDPRFDSLKVKGEGYIAARLLNSNLDAGLKPLYKLYIDPQVEDYSFKSLFLRPYTKYDPKLVYPYAAVDAQKHLILTNYLESKLKTEFPDLYRLYNKLEIPVQEVVYSMEEQGILMDRNWLKQLQVLLTSQSESKLERLRELVHNYDFNPNSPKQVLQVFNSLNFNITSTKEEVIKEIDHPVADLLLEYRGIEKLATTYGENLLEFASEDGVAHPIFNPLGTDSGRFSSTRFNAQNIPKDNRFRNIFISRPNHKLISVDYSQQEVRVLASLAEDEAMIEAFRSGKDFYAVMASLAFNLPYNTCTKHGERADLRAQMKSVVLGLNYGMGMKRLAKDLGKTVTEAQEIYNRFQQTCPKIALFKKKCKDFAYAHGYVETVLKRRRYFKGVGYKALKLPRFECEDKAVLETLYKIKDDRWAVSRLIEDAKKENIKIIDREALAFAEERQCTNSVVQGSAADETKLAMVAFDNNQRAKELGAKIVLQIHDEIIIDCPQENAVEAGALLAEIMNGVMEELFNIPGGAVPEIMDRWTKE